MPKYARPYRGVKFSTDYEINLDGKEIITVEFNVIPSKLAVAIKAHDFVEGTFREISLPLNFFTAAILGWMSP